MNPLPTEVDSGLLNSDTRGFKGYTSGLWLTKSSFLSMVPLWLHHRAETFLPGTSSTVPTVHAFFHKYYIKHTWWHIQPHRDVTHTTQECGELALRHDARDFIKNRLRKRTLPMMSMQCSLFLRSKRLFYVKPADITTFQQDEFKKCHQKDQASLKWKHL